ncbi:MAG: hypothetical protein ACK4IT_04975 [Thioalkalivibrionaceae bacterium]
MMMSAAVLSALVIAATVVATLTPILLIALFVRDVKRGCLW